MNSFASAQKLPAYIQINANVDALGNIRMMAIENVSIKDTATTFRVLRIAVQESKSAIDAINRLADLHWKLVAVAPLLSGNQGRPNSPFIAYYFKNDN